jgi:UDP-2-acetamido-3-amino-2,3-dideoxy-glucuronate N-acetyltransferase
MNPHAKYFIHPSAQVTADLVIGENSRIWQSACIMADVIIGNQCSICNGAVLAEGTRLGDCVIIDNYANLLPAHVESGAFIGPLACIISDANPRATDGRGGRRKGRDVVRRIPIIRQGSSVGAGSIIMPGVVIGQYANVCAGSVVGRNVGDYMIVAGNPARQVGYACQCGLRLSPSLQCSCTLSYKLLNGGSDKEVLVPFQKG